MARQRVVAGSFSAVAVNEILTQQHVANPAVALNMTGGTAPTPPAPPAVTPTFNLLLLGMG